MDGDGTTTPVAGRASAVGVYDPSNARDALRFVSEMLQAGTGEEVVQQESAAVSCQTSGVNGRLCFAA